MTVSEGIERTATCPICDSIVNVDQLVKSGLSHHELSLFDEHVRNGTIKDVLNCGDLMLRRRDPEARNIELQVAKTISQLRNTFNQLYTDFKDDVDLMIKGTLKTNEEERREDIVRFQEKGDAILGHIDTAIKRLDTINRDNQTIQNISSNVNEILRKIGGNGVGSIGETITIKDLKRVAPMDDFDETRATHGGTDIIGKVNENGTTYGAVTVSVKYTQKWDNDYLEQIANNMHEDHSKFGVLVSKTFPRESLSDKAWVMKTREGNSVILVKPEYAPLAYFGLRQATIMWFQTRQLQERKEHEVEEMEKTFKALMYWINGEEFRECISWIDCAIHEANTAKNLLNSLKKHIDNKIDDVFECQVHITDKLTNAKGLVRKLSELLNGDSHQ